MPDEPCGEADQQRLSERLRAPELVSEPGSDDPGEHAHRDSRRRPHPKDLRERVLPYRCIPINFFGERLGCHSAREPNQLSARYRS